MDRTRQVAASPAKPGSDDTQPLYGGAETQQNGVSRPSRSPGAFLRRLGVAAILVAPVVIVTGSFWPGHMNADTLSQIGMAMTGEFYNHHAALLSALWSPFYDLGVGPGWVLTGQVAVFVVGLYLVLRGAFGPIPAALVSAAISLSPPVFGTLGLVGRDVWFTALLLLTFGLLVSASREAGRTRTTFLALAVVAAWLALATRQNAAAAVLLACVALVALAVSNRTAGLSRVRRVGLVCGGGVALTAVLFGSQIGMARAIDVRDVDPEQFLLVYDVAAISKREGQNLFPSDVMRARGLAPVERYFNVDTVNPLMLGPDPPIQAFMPPTQLESLREGWTSAVTGNPVDYLGERWELYLRQIAVTRNAVQIYHPVIDGNTLGFKIRFPELNNAAKDYVEAFATIPYPTAPIFVDGGAVFTIWVYLLIALAGALVLLRRSRPPALVCVGVLALSALTYQSGLFFGAMGTQYRLEYPAVVIGLAVLAVLLSLAWQQVRGRDRATHHAR